MNNDVDIKGIARDLVLRHLYPESINAEQFGEEVELRYPELAEEEQWDAADEAYVLATRILDTLYQRYQEDAK